MNLWGPDIFMWGKDTNVSLHINSSHGFCHTSVAVVHLQPPQLLRPTWKWPLVRCWHLKLLPMQDHWCVSGCVWTVTALDEYGGNPASVVTHQLSSSTTFLETYANSEGHANHCILLYLVFYITSQPFYILGCGLILMILMQPNLYGQLWKIYVLNRITGI